MSGDKTTDIQNPEVQVQDETEPVELLNEGLEGAEEPDAIDREEEEEGEGDEDDEYDDDEDDEYHDESKDAEEDDDEEAGRPGKKQNLTELLLADKGPTLDEDEDEDEDEEYVEQYSPAEVTPTAGKNKRSIDEVGGEGVENDAKKVKA